ncbi:MAG: putative DNA modification/repair radical SAM protein [Clostridiales bacterium]|nr:putative DNA modification/repair radical SAM protein [Clostridiales bacterium]
MEAIMEKLKILADSAKYDVSCSSSGVGRDNNATIGSAHASGICHSWGADGRCISLLKVLFTNKCAYNCEYCVNKRTNDFPRASFEPEELAKLTIEFYRRNYIEGLFLSSAVEVSPDYTAERILESLRLLRYEYGFAGYIHAKIIPGVSPEILHQIGLVADRLSVNIELPTSESLEVLAPQKRPKAIFSPMRQITNSLIERNALKGPGTMFKGQELNTAGNYLGNGATDRNVTAGGSPLLGASSAGAGSSLRGNSLALGRGVSRRKESFAPAGQTTQMIIGVGGETDQSILTTGENLYRTFKMKRVYYSAYIPVVDSPVLPDKETAPPLAREHRIYQADWLLRFYGFSVGELFKGGEANLDPDLDPKVIWALRNLEQFPVEVNKASYQSLMRIPGIGAISAKRIVRQRRFAAVQYDDLKKMGVVLKRAKYFLTCSGKYYGDRVFEPEVIKNSMLQMENGLQLSLFDNGWNRLEEGARQEKLAFAGVI